MKPHALLNGISNYDTKLKELNSAQIGFTVQNKTLQILKDYLNLLWDLTII